MSAEDEVRQACANLGAMADDVFIGVVGEALRSITDGSEITGAPGQPVQTGALKSSWQATFPTATEALVATNSDYAEPIEEGVGPHGPMTLRSAVGGFHSVALTAAGLPRIVDAVAERVAAQHRAQGFNNGSAGWSGEDGG